jgi:hypothetical protein
VFNILRLFKNKFSETGFVSVITCTGGDLPNHTGPLENVILGFEVVTSAIMKIYLLEYNVIFLTLKIEAIYSSEASVDFQRFYRFIY